MAETTTQWAQRNSIPTHHLGVDPSSSRVPGVFTRLSRNLSKPRDTVYSKTPFGFGAGSSQTTRNTASRSSRSSHKSLTTTTDRWWTPDARSSGCLPFLRCLRYPCHGAVGNKDLGDSTSCTFALGVAAAVKQRQSCVRGRGGGLPVCRSFREREVRTGEVWK